MGKVKQFTNYYVVHSVWVMVISVMYLILNILQHIESDSCIELYVGVTQIRCVIPGVTGLLVFLIRLFDRDFYSAIINLFLKVSKSKDDDSEILIFKSTFSIDSKSFEDKAKLVQLETFSCVYKSQYLKVISWQFIIDSLISLTFYTLTPKPNWDSYTESASCYSQPEVKLRINVDEIKSFVKSEQFSRFFCGCKPHTVTSRNYNVIEYFPALFRSLRLREGINDDTLVQYIL